MDVSNTIEKGGSSSIHYISDSGGFCLSLSQNGLNVKSDISVKNKSQEKRLLLIF